MDNKEKAAKISELAEYFTPPAVAAASRRKAICELYDYMREQRPNACKTKILHLMADMPEMEGESAYTIGQIIKQYHHEKLA